ncbi:MAG: hypothetical protein IH993_02525 [Proteobacteria bacterium]|nr:hypothetical protein [Pseudomonadota bacterium]
MQSFWNSKASIWGLALMIALSLAAMPSTAVAAAEGLRFLVFGDAPYTKRQIEMLKNTVAPAIRNAESSFLIHLGDFKGGGESCIDDFIQTRYEQLMDLRPGRVFYTPGDNEWTDCDRPYLEPPSSELESLDFLRSLILSRPLNLPDDWHYANQEEQGFPENARWTQGNVMFATVHMVSTNNGRRQILLDDIETALGLVDARDKANLVWLRAAFDAAGTSDSGAVVIATQADVTKHAGSALCNHSLLKKCDAFAAFRDQLLDHAASFNKPVLLVHGDTNPFCLDKKFGEKTAPKLWRLNALGDGSEVDATVVTVQLDNPEEPFAIAPLMTDTWLGRTCP